MEKIYLNLRCTHSCWYEGGHRTSDGWVHGYSVTTEYSFTASSSDAKISLKACCVFDLIFQEYSNSHDYEDDRYQNIDNIDSYCNVYDVDISAQIKQLNEVQHKYEFVQVSEPLEFDAKELIINSRREEDKVNQIIRNNNEELSKQIRFLQERNRKELLAKISPHIINLIKEDQLDLFSKDKNVNLYPMDILAINNEYELLIASILRYRDIPFEKFNEVYSLLTTGAIPYLDILNGTVKDLNKNENIILSEFLKEMEKRYRHESCDYINSPSYSNTDITGLCNLFGHLLSEIGVDKCYEMIDWWENSGLPENQRSVFSFHSEYLFPYFIIVLLAEKKNLDKNSFFEKYRYEPGFSSIPFIFDQKGIYFNQLVPYFKKILQSPNAIEILSLILRESDIEFYRDEVNNQEIFTCKNNKRACMGFVRRTLRSFIANE